MREIKFRAWDTQERKWFDPTYRAYEGKVEDLLIGLNGHLIKRESHQLSHESMFPNRYVLNQFTGLRDKNGKEIYEGDIIDVDCDCDPGEYDCCAHDPWKGYVAWHDEYSSFELFGLDHSPSSEAFESHYEDVWTVFGNIYENPELLEVQNNE